MQHFGFSFAVVGSVQQCAWRAEIVLKLACNKSPASAAELRTVLVHDNAMLLPQSYPQHRSGAPPPQHLVPSDRAQVMQGPAAAGSQAVAVQEPGTIVLATSRCPAAAQTLERSPSFWPSFSFPMQQRLSDVGQRRHGVRSCRELLRMRTSRCVSYCTRQSRRRQSAALAQDPPLSLRGQGPHHFAGQFAARAARQAAVHSLSIIATIPRLSTARIVAASDVTAASCKAPWSGLSTFRCAIYVMMICVVENQIRHPRGSGGLEGCHAVNRVADQEDACFRVDYSGRSPRSV